MAEQATATATPAATPVAATLPAASNAPADTTPKDAAPKSVAPKNGGNGAQQVKTLAETDPPDGTAATPADWPANWRDIMSGGDAKALETLKRFHSPVNLFKSWSSARQKFSTGEIVRSKPEGEDEAALNEWRAQAGIPAKPEGYLDKVPDGLVFGDADKPMLESFLQDMHANDAPPGFVHSALKWYKANEERSLRERSEADKTHRIGAEDTLRSEWGPEYRGNLNSARAAVETIGGKELLTRLFSARMSDGTPLGDDPDTLRFLVAVDKAINPHGSIPLPDSAAGKAMSNEMADIRKAMADKKSEYWSGPRDANGQTRMQNRYQELIDMEGRRGK